MTHATPSKRLPRGVPTKILNFDGPSFSLQLTQSESDFGDVSASKFVEKRSKSQHDKSKEVQVDKSPKEIKNQVGSKRKTSIKASRNKKGIDLFVKNQPKLAPHISSYTNTEIVSHLKEKLTPEQYQQFSHTVFGPFLQMKRCDVQHQLFRCFMSLQLNGTPSNVFGLYVNGTELYFTLREFAVVTGLKCVGEDVDFEFGESMSNRLVVKYFGGANIVKKKDLIECFNNKAWGIDNDEDALKIALLYFIHTFIFSSEKSIASIPKLHFNLVESGRYSEYHWGVSAFDMLINSISKKMDIWLSKSYMM